MVVTPLLRPSSIRSRVTASKKSQEVCSPPSREEAVPSQRILANQLLMRYQSCALSFFAPATQDGCRSKFFSLVLFIRAQQRRRLSVVGRVAGWDTVLLLHFSQGGARCTDGPSRP